jgi:hypothetical protein
MPRPAALALALLLAAAAAPPSAAALPWLFDDPVPARTSAQCRAAAGLRAFQGAGQAYPAVARWLGLEGPVLAPPVAVTDVTTLHTLASVR